jgi:DNA-binding NarL/FixJ family response regulator
MPRQKGMDLMTLKGRRTISCQGVKVMSTPFVDPVHRLNARNRTISAAMAAQQGSEQPRLTISMISAHPFELEMLGSLLANAFVNAEIRSFRTAAEWERASTADAEHETVLYNIGDGPISERGVKAALREFISRAGQRRVVVMSRDDDLMATCEAIDCGAASYIPPSVGVDELIAALHGSSSKSVVLPRQSMMALCAALGEAMQRRPGLDRYFTDRQLSVAQSLRRGAANKTIAYELGLCESTVKVHIRNIMRKLKATNRTQAASRLNDLANGNCEVDMSTGH